MSTAGKLTKKQKKTLAFRERKIGKRKDHDASVMDDEDGYVPAMEDQNMADAYDDSLEVQVEKGKNGKSSLENQKGKVKAKYTDEQVAEKSKKRQREEETTTQAKREAKRAKVSDDSQATEQTVQTKVAKTQRFILFVGNLKYTTSLEAIQAHFGACDPPPTIRLLTPKPSPTTGKRSFKSKGCAFLEFSHHNALQQALKLHQSELDNRMINVELTAGGGGRSENRLTKVRQRNKELLGQRKTRTEKRQAHGSPPSIVKPQRYSTTSGMDQQPAIRRTWTVEDRLEEETHRGGKKHIRARQTRRKAWGTGVNAIPVG